MESLIKPIAFYLFSAAAIVSAVLVIVKKNPVASAMNLVVTFFSLSAIYVLLNSQFIAIMQILVYAGAIMVLIIFVIMLLNLRPSTTSIYKKTTVKGFFIAFFVLVMGFSLFIIIFSGKISGIQSGITDAKLAEGGTIQIISRSIFSEFLLPFELTSLLLTVAIIGAVVLAKGMVFKKKSDESNK